MMKQSRRFIALCLCLMLTLSASTASAASKTFTKVPTLKIDFSSSIESYSSDDLTIDASIPGFLTVTLLTASGSEVLTLLDRAEVRSGDNVFEFFARDAEGAPLNPGQYIFSASMVSQFDVASKEVTEEFEVEAMSEENAEAYQDMLAAGMIGNVSQSSADVFDSAIESASSAAQETEEIDEYEEIQDYEEYEEYEETEVVEEYEEYEEIQDYEEYEEYEETEVIEEVEEVEEYEEPEVIEVVEEPAPAPAAPQPSSTAYTTGSYVMGDEGLQIGVGVTDTATQSNPGYWALSSSSSDVDIWNAIIKPMTAVNVDEQESAYIYNSPEDGRKKLGTVSGFSQGLNLVHERDDGWSLVEAFRNEDGAFVRGYIRTNKLRTLEPDPTYGMVIDKATQTLTVYKEGQRLGSTKVSTGLATPEYPHRETPAGEFVTATRRGTIEYYGMGYSKYTIRINNTYYLCEIPTTRKNGSDFSLLENEVGSKATRGHVCVAHDASSDGGINASWIWDMTTGRKRVKVLILDDKARSDVPITE